MPIIGLTINEHGEPIQRLAVATKVSIGEVKRAANGKTYPSTLDHFAFLQKSKELGWETDTELTEHYGNECRAFWVFFMNDDIEQVFKTNLAWWSQTERKCWGDGKDAIRRTEKHPEGEPWHPCGSTCPQFDKECAPSGDLYFRLVDFPRVGATCRIHTSGKRSVQQIYSALMELQTLTGGRLVGVRAKLVVRPEKTSYFDEKEKKKKPTVIYALNLEHDRKESMEQLISNMTETSRLFERTQKLLGRAHVEVDEPEDELAREISQEFPAPATIQQPERVSASATAAGSATTNTSPQPGPMAPPPAAIPPDNGFITREQRQQFFQMTIDKGLTGDQVKEMLKKQFGWESSAVIPAARFAEVCEWFRNPPQTQSMFEEQKKK